MISGHVISRFSCICMIKILEALFGKFTCKHMSWREREKIKIMSLPDFFGFSVLFSLHSGRLQP